MKTCEYPLEIRRSPLYIFYSTLVQNPTTIVSILYFGMATHSQVRFDIGTSSPTTMLQKLEAMFVLSCDWKSSSRSCPLASKVLPWDIVDPRMNAHLSPSFSRLHALYVDPSHLPLNLMIWSRLLSLAWTNSVLVTSNLLINLWSRIVRPTLQTCTVL
jgi:hypothetical protein